MVPSCPALAALARLGPAVPDGVADLGVVLAGVPDPRRRRGVRHSLVSILVAPRAIAGLRNLAVNAPRHAGHTDIAAGCGPWPAIPHDP